MKLFLLILGVIACVFAVKCIFDARPIAKKYFNKADRNTASNLLKIFGFILLILGGVIIHFNI